VNATSHPARPDCTRSRPNTSTRKRGSERSMPHREHQWGTFGHITRKEGTSLRGQAHLQTSRFNVSRLPESTTHFPAGPLMSPRTVNISLMMSPACANQAAWHVGLIRLPSSPCSVRFQTHHPPRSVCCSPVCATFPQDATLSSLIRKGSESSFSSQRVSRSTHAPQPVEHAACEHV
jgi:hypothetical protein